MRFTEPPPSSGIRLLPTPLRRGLANVYSSTVRALSGAFTVLLSLPPRSPFSPFLLFLFSFFRRSPPHLASFSLPLHHSLTVTDPLPFSSAPLNSPYGENLAASAGTGLSVTPSLVDALIKLWEDEAADYTPATPNYSHLCVVSPSFSPPKLWKLTYCPPFQHSNGLEVVDQARLCSSGLHAW